MAKSAEVQAEPAQASDLSEVIHKVAAEHNQRSSTHALVHALANHLEHVPATRDELNKLAHGLRVHADAIADAVQKS